METKNSGLSAIVDRPEDTILASVREIDGRIETILNRNLTVTASTRGIVVSTFLSVYTFKNIAEAREAFPNVDSYLYR